MSLCRCFKILPCTFCTICTFYKNLHETLETLETLCTLFALFLHSPVRTFLYVFLLFLLSLSFPKFSRQFFNIIS